MIKSLLLSLILMVGIISVNANDLSAKITSVAFASSNFEQVTTTIGEIKVDTKITVTAYPNPTTGIVYVESTNLISEVKIVDSYGQVMKAIGGVNSRKVLVDMSLFSTGVYFIITSDMLEDDDSKGVAKQHTMKIIKQ